jgi:uncharacterized protein (TIGR03437 family)
MFDAFDFAQQPRPPVILLPSGSPYPAAKQVLNHGSAVVSVNAAYATYTVAADAIASAYGESLAGTTAQAPALPLPVSLGGTSISVTDSTGAVRSASLFHVSPTQINYLIPTGTAAGTATITVSTASGATFTGSAQVAHIAPALFTAENTGNGPAAAQVLYVNPDGSQTIEPTVQCGPDGQNCTLVPIALAPQSGQVFLMLYGTGIRNHTGPVTASIADMDAPVTYAGAQGQYAGLDQVNLSVPPDLAGRGRTLVTLLVDGQSANVVQVLFQ